MALTLFRNVTVQLAKNAALTPLVGEQKLEAKKDSATLFEGHSISKIVATTASDEVVTMGGVTTGKYIRVETDQPLTIKLSGTGNTGILINVPSTEIPGSFDCTVDFTSIHLSNAGTTDANVSVIVAGV